MTSLIRGFDTSLRDSINALGPKVIFVQRFGGLSLASGSSFMQLMRRPVLTVDDGDAIRRLATTVQIVDTWLGAAPPQPTQQRLFYRGERTRPNQIFGTTERFVHVNFAKMFAGRIFTEQEVIRRRNVAVIGYGPQLALFANRHRSDRQARDRRRRAYFIVGVIASAGGRRLQSRPGRLCDHPLHGAPQSSSAPNARGPAFGGTGGMIAIAPRESATREDTMREVESIMRIRHGLTLDKPNDFDLVTPDAILAVWDQISSAILLSLVVISSIALMVGGIGVMAIMTISVTERTREIGVRKAIGARRREILIQFLIEAVVLTSVGGVLGVILGSGIGLLVNVISGFPVSLPWWSFALGLGFSASVGIFFGVFPAWRASRLDPIEALRYE